MTFEVTITKLGDTQPFWSKRVLTRADAERISAANQRLINRHKWDHVVSIKEHRRELQRRKDTQR